MNKYTRLLSDTVILGIGNFATKLIYFFLMPIYTLALTPADFGFVDLLNNSLQIIMPIATLCISDGVFRFVLDKNCDPKSLLSNGIRIINIGAIFVIAICATIYLYTRDTVWILFAVLYLTEAYKSVMAQFIRGLGRVKVYAFNGILGSVILLVSSYLLLRTVNLGINGYLISFVLANGFSIGYLLYSGDVIKHINIRAADKTVIKTLLLFSIPLVPNMLSWWVTNISSRYIIAFFSGLAASGLFAAASKLPALINIIASVFQLSWQYASVKEQQQNKPGEFYNTVFKYYSYLVCVSGSVLIALVPYISYIILKDSFYPAWRYTPLLLYSAILGCYSTFWGNFYTVAKNSKGIMRTTIVGAVINLALCLALVPFISVTGALIANIVSYCAITLIRIIEYRHLLENRVDWPIIVFSLVIMLVECISLYVWNCNLTRIISFSIPFVIILLYYPRGITPMGILRSLRK